MSKVLATLFATALASIGASAPLPPNFLFILGEGHGWSSTSVQMDDAVPESRSSFVQTPNLEKLAAAGMRLARFYAPSPRCTPSRVAIFTGKSPAQLHITFVSEGKRETGVQSNSKLLPAEGSVELPEAETTVAEVLRRAGYATAHFGKWHMGRLSPSRHGYNEHDGANGNGGPDNVANPHPKQLLAMTSRGIDFMERQAKAGKPFWLQLSHYAARQGGAATAESLAAVKARGGNRNEREITEAAADLDLDQSLGRLLECLNRLKIADRTFVIFTTDHGTPGKNPPLAGGKGGVSEGGLRVPCVIRGPGIQGGACSRVFATGVDLLPTVAELARVSEPLPQGVEGASLATVLRNRGEGTVKRPREEFVVHFPHYDKDPLGPASAILLGNLKLVRIHESDARHLYDLAKDPGERRDLAKEMLDQVKDLDSRLSDYLHAVKANLPRANPEYDPSKPSGGVDPKRGDAGGRGGNRKQKQNP